MSPKKPTLTERVHTVEGLTEKHELDLYGNKDRDIAGIVSYGPRLRRIELALYVLILGVGIQLALKAFGVGDVDAPILPFSQTEPTQVVREVASSPAQEPVTTPHGEQLLSNVPEIKIQVIPLVEDLLDIVLPDGD